VQGGLDEIRKEAWPFYRTISGVRLYWVLEELKGPQGRVGGARSLCAMSSGASDKAGQGRRTSQIQCSEAAAADLNGKIQCGKLSESARQGELPHRRPPQLIL